MARTKTDAQNNTETRGTPRRSRHSEKKLFLYFVCVCLCRIFYFFIYNEFKRFLQEMLSSRLGTSMTCIGGLN